MIFKIYCTVFKSGGTESNIGGSDVRVIWQVLLGVQGSERALTIRFPCQS